MKLVKALERYIHPEDLIIAGLIGLYAVLCYLLASAYGYGGSINFFMYGDTAKTRFSLTFLILYLLYRLVRVYYIMLFVRPKPLYPYLWQDLRRGPLNGEHWRQFPILFVSFIVFFSCFTSMKILASEIHPFAWDETLMRADKALHFGVDPWRILHPLLGHRVVTKILACFYVLWFPGIFAVMYWQLFSLEKRSLRFRFFATLVIAWGLNGTFLATFFSSAGPCFYSQVTGDAYYAPLMEYLHRVNAWSDIYAITAQDFLWQHYLTRGQVMMAGISAMPSIHVGIMFLFVLLGYQKSKFWFRLFLAWFACIFLGSIHLGWHYALDGYVSIVTTSIVWMLTGVAIRRFKPA